MTIIIAVRHERGVVLGADNWTHHGDLLMRRAVPKLWNVSPYLAVGCAGETRLIEVLRSLTWPKVEGCTPYEVNMDLHAKLPPALKTEWPDPKERDFSAIIAANGALFQLASDLSFVSLEDPYWAIGHGKQVALGAMAIMHRTTRLCEPRVQIEAALDACAYHVSGIGAPWVFAETTLST